MKFTKPNRLKKGDKVAVVSPSWAGPSVFPNIYERGLSVLTKWGLVVEEYPSARLPSDPSLDNVKQRAEDINNGFSAPEIKAIFTSIGGDDCIRLLPYLDRDVIASNPTILMGFSDTTAINVFLNQLGLVSFNGPSIMAGLSQMDALPEVYSQHVHSVLFGGQQTLVYPSFNQYCNGYPDWSVPENVGKTHPLKTDTGMRTLKGTGVVNGQLLGGCIEVLDLLKGTEYWPKIVFFENKILFLETSEDKPSIDSVKRSLRNLGVQGVFDKISALLFARPRDYSDSEKQQLEQAIKHVITIEFNNNTLPIAVNAEFGHCDPQIVLPNGITAQLDLSKCQLSLLESCVK